MKQAVWITEAEVAALIDMGDAIIAGAGALGAPPARDGRWLRRFGPSPGLAA